VVRAVELTLFDVADDFLATLLSSGDATLHGAGLRGGRWAWDFSAPLRLDRVELVPGVRLSGRVARFATRGQSAHLRVSAPHGLGGRLTLDGSRVRARLGGRRVNAQILIGVLEEARATAAAAHNEASALRRRPVRRRGDLSPVARAPR
jgi:hypothetical protein